MRHLVILFTVLFNNLAYATAINIIAAENFYGQLAKEIGGGNVNVTSILTNPNADPHLFTTTSTIHKAIEQAQIIIYNGANYDGWIEQMLAVTKRANVVKVSDLMQLNPQKINNPHIWYKPETMPTVASGLTNLLIKIDNQHKAQYERNLAKFLQGNNQVQNHIARLKATYSSIAVIATEPIFNYMTDAIGLQMYGLDLQWKIMNNTDPSPKMLADYFDLLKNHKVQVLFYNKQVFASMTKNILAIAKKNNIPVVGISETMPQNISVNTWLDNQLDRTEAALAKSKRAQP